MDRALLKKLWALSVPVLYIQEEYSSPTTRCNDCGATHDKRHVAFTRPIVEGGRVEKTDLIAWCQTCDQYDIFFQAANTNQDGYCKRA